MVTLFMVNSCLDITYTIHIIWLYHDIWSYTSYRGYPMFA